MKAKWLLHWLKKFISADKLYCEAELKRKNTEVGVCGAQANIERWERL